MKKTKVVRKRKKTHQFPTFLAGGGRIKRKSVCFPNVYKVVNVNCRLPSSTGLMEVKEDVKEAVIEIESIEQLKTKPEEKKVKKEKNLNKTNTKPEIIKKKSKAKVTENVQKPKEEKQTKPTGNDCPIGFQINPKTNEIVTEAHRMIWFWLFNGLFPTNIHKKNSGMKLHK